MSSFVFAESNEKESVIVNLKVLSSLDAYQKLNTKSKHFTITQFAYIPEFLVRWYLRQNRDSDYQRLMDLYDIAFKIFKEDTTIENDLRNSIKGLNNLKKTYEPDITFNARMDYLIDRIKSMLNSDESSSSEDESK